MILVTIEGGVVQGVHSSNAGQVGARVAVLDYDTEPHDSSSLVDLFDDGAMAHLHFEEVQKLGPETLTALEHERTARGE